MSLVLGDDVPPLPHTQFARNRTAPRYCRRRRHHRYYQIQTKNTSCSGDTPEIEQLRGEIARRLFTERRAAGEGIGAYSPPTRPPGSPPLTPLTAGGKGASPEHSRPTSPRSASPRGALKGPGKSGGICEDKAAEVGGREWGGGRTAASPTRSAHSGERHVSIHLLSVYVSLILVNLRLRLVRGRAVIIGHEIFIKRQCERSRTMTPSKSKKFAAFPQGANPVLPKGETTRAWHDCMFPLVSWAGATFVPLNHAARLYGDKITRMKHPRSVSQSPSARSAVAARRTPGGTAREG